MHNPARIILYSSSAIVLLVLMWGFRQIPQQGNLADLALRESLNQEMIVLTSAVKSATQAMKYRLLDVLKAEGNDHVTRTFQDSPFIAAALLEWDQVQWKSDWFSVKNKNLFQNGELKTWLKDWPLSRLAIDEVYFTKVADIDGQAYFVMLVPVRKPNQIPMVGMGIFPANQFGLNFSAEENRELRVFTHEGLALALTHPAYLGSSLRSEPIVHEMLANEEVSLRHEWKSEHGPMIALSERIADTNLFAALETRATTPSRVAAWTYLLLTALGAGALNWVLFKSIFAGVMSQLSQAEAGNESLRRQLSERLAAANPKARESVVMEEPPPLFVPSNDTILPKAPLGEMEFSEEVHTLNVPVEEPLAPATSARLDQVVTASLKALNEKISERGIKVMQFGLEDLEIEGDPLQLQTAVEEIFKNSIEAMDEGQRELTISGRKLKESIQLTVEDTGRGVAEGDVEKVFDPFFSTKDSQGVARGLGLNVVRRVVEEMKGRVQLASESGKGTRVEIEFSTALANAQPSLDFSAPKIPEVELPVALSDEPPPLKWPEVSIRKPRVRTLE